MKRLCILLTIFLLLPSFAICQETMGEKIAVIDAELQVLFKLFVLPGLSAGIVKDGELIWSKGYGFADMKKKIPANGNTPYRIASLSKPFAAVIVMQELEKGNLTLDALLSDFPAVAKDLKNRDILLKHILNHTSHDLGKTFRYSGFAFDQVTAVLEQVTGKSYFQLLKERFTYRFELKNTSTGETTGEFDSINNRLAKAYKYTPERGLFPGEYLDYKATAAAGIISSVTDIARFDAELDRGFLVSEKSKQMMFAPTISTDDQKLPYGIGFFVQDYQGKRIYWHYGFWECSSSLYIKVPEMGITFILLSNSENLSRTFILSDGNLVGSPFARTLLSALQ